MYDSYSQRLHFLIAPAEVKIVLRTIEKCRVFVKAVKSLVHAKAPTSLSKVSHEKMC